MSSFLPQDPVLLIAMAVAALVVLVGLGVYGFRDLRRLSGRRIGAVAGLTFREGVRRRVLWITPLAMAAVLLLINLGNPLNETNAIAQAVGVCLFASGLVAIVVPLVLASTSLPREVENKAIFTVVTKPLTRLELLFGKLCGFALLSAAVLAIMGVFSYGLLLVRERSLVRDIEQRLASTLAVPGQRPYLQHLADSGLLRSEAIDPGRDFQVYSLPPETSPDRRWTFGGRYMAAVPFTLDPARAEALYTQTLGNRPARLRVAGRPAWQVRGRLPSSSLPLGVINPDRYPAPTIKFGLYDAGLYTMPAAFIRPELPPTRNGDTGLLNVSVRAPGSPDTPWEDVTALQLDAATTQRLIEQMSSPGGAFIGVWGNSTGYYYGTGADTVRLELVDPDENLLDVIEPAIPADARSAILFRTNNGQRGFGLIGPEDEQKPALGVLAYRDVGEVETIDNGADDGRVGIELQVVVERISGVLDEGNATRVEAQVVNVETGYASPPQVLEAETGAPVWLTVPAEATAGGNFDLRLKTLSRNQIVSLRANDVRVAVGRDPFLFNLAKGLAGQWLLSVLVALLALVFSTFVSWPIAIVLTVGALSGRWVADQLAGSLTGLGREAVTTGGNLLDDAAAVRVVETGFDALGNTVAVIARFLPPVAPFDASELVGDGRRVPAGQLISAAGVVVGFGLPLLTVAYVVLRNKEVAP